MWNRYTTFILWCLLSDVLVQSLLLHTTTQQQQRPSFVAIQKLPGVLLFQRQQQDQWNPTGRSVLSKGLRANSNDDKYETTSISPIAYDAEIEDLKSEVIKYLQIRQEIGADDIAKEYVFLPIGALISFGVRKDYLFDSHLLCSTLFFVM